jgi:hypothetical protein
MRRIHAIPMMLVDASLTAALAAGGMATVLAIAYVGRELIRYNPLG